MDSSSGPKKKKERKKKREFGETRIRWIFIKSWFAKLYSLWNSELAGSSFESKQAPIQLVGVSVSDYMLPHRLTKSCYHTGHQIGMFSYFGGALVVEPVLIEYPDHKY